MLEVENLVAGYEGIPVVHGVDLRVGEGELVALVGANGVGKSTTVKAISGILSPMDGAITFRDERIDGLDPHEIVRRGVIQVPERRELFPTMSVEDNLLMGAQTKRAKERRDENLEWVYDLFPRLGERTDQRAKTMSGGEQQMLTLARALMGDPELLIFDELSVGLAPQILDGLFETVAEIHESGVTVVVIEQNVRKALSMADRGYVMENGEVVLEGTGEELLDEDRVKEAYLGM